MRSSTYLMCILLILVCVLPVLAAEPTGAVTTEPVIIHGVTREVTTVTTAVPTKEPTTEPTTEPTKEVTTVPTKESTTERTTEPTKEPTTEPTKIPTTSSAPKVGWITIASSPSGATVSLDGKTVGITPVAGTEVGAGISHMIRITKDGYEPYEKSVTVSSGEQSAVDATLMEIVTPTKTPTPTPTATQSPIGGGKGWIRINANVDGSSAALGSESCTITGGSCSIMVGTATTPVKTFTVQKSGYSEYSGPITTWPKEGETVDVYATLNPVTSTGSLQVTSYPSGAVATLDGGNWQYTPAQFTSVSAGTDHYVQISQNGYQTYAATVYVSAGETAYVSATLDPVQPSTGSLRVATNPSGADIYVDGRYMAASPNTLTNLAPGTHTLRMHKAGYDEYLRTFFITAGQRTTVDYTFTPQSASFGSIEVASTPAGATLFLDGNYMGLTQPGDYFDLTSLVPGTHTITLRMTDYQVYTQTVYVRGGTVETINAQMVPVIPGPVADTTGQITVVSSPPGAELYLDNVFKGITPLTLSDIQQGSHVVTVKQAGYAEATQTITVTGGQTTPVALGLVETSTTTTAKTPLTVLPVILGLILVGGAIRLKKK
jgi:hypothetical protein